MKVHFDNLQWREVMEERKHAEAMVLVLVWLLLEVGQRMFESSSLWRGSHTFFLAWLLLSTKRTSLLRWIGLPIVTFIVWFPDSMPQALIYSLVLGVGFLGFQKAIDKESKSGFGFWLKASGLVLLLSGLRVILNYFLLDAQVSGNALVNFQKLWLPDLARYGIDLLASLPFYMICLIPCLQIPFLAEGHFNTSHRPLPSWKAVALCLIAAMFWGLRLAHVSIPFGSPWLWIVSLLLGSWAGLPGVATAVYGAYLMNFSDIQEAKILYDSIWKLLGLASLAYIFADLSFRERNRLKDDNRKLEQHGRTLQEKLYTEERLNLSLKTRIDSNQKLVLRSIQELHAHLTPVVLTSKLLSQKALQEKEGIALILQGAADKQMHLLQNLQEAIQIPGNGMVGQAQRVSVEGMLSQLIPRISEISKSRSVTLNVGSIAPQVAVQSWPDCLLESFEHLLRHLILFGEPDSQISVRVYAQPQKIHLQLRHSNYSNRQGVLAGLVDGNLMSKEALALAVNFDVGLYTACRLLESMGGQLSIFEKAAQHHLTFAIQLPAAIDEDLMTEGETGISSAVARFQPQLVAVDGRLPPRRLLLVEDDKTTQKLLESILRNSGIEVRSYESAQEAYESFCSFRPDVVIADLGLPDSNGFELIKRLRSVAKYNFYAIAFSANNHRNVLKTALSAGFDSFLPKPLAVQDLCRALRIA